MDVDDELIVLLELRLVGLAPAAAIGSRPLIARHGIAGRLDSALREAADRGWLDERRGRIGGWLLTPAGRDHLDALMRRDLEQRGVHDAVEELYARFLPLNRELLAVCTRWQVSRDASGAEVPNRHDDPDADRATIDALGALHETAAGLLDELSGTFDRFTHYHPRLDHAIERIRSGDHDWFTRPMIDSYHTVWFELHEHLLATLGRARSEESRSNPGVFDREH